jgi:hypothetical protein
MHWEAVSPDLTAGEGASPEAAPGAAAAASGTGGRGGGPAISALAFSPKDAKEIWAGTSNSRIQLTRDGGGHWNNVAPGDLAPGASVAAIEASPSDPARAFAVFAGGRGGTGGGGGPGPGGPGPGASPRIYRTGDYGQSWKLGNTGLPASAAHAVREDPESHNLVFAALDAGVFVSFNGGDQWQPLQLNLPAASCRDLALEQNTLIVATYGRALWAIDNISPLRELAQKATQVAASNAYLFPPAPAVRMQWDTYTDTPLNPDVAAAENPPDGAVIDYYLKSPPASEIKLEVYDSAGTLVRSYSSSGTTSLGYKVNVPDFWLAPAPLLPKQAGLNRFVWDLRYPDPEQLLYTYYGVHVNYFEYTLADHAIPHNTPWHEPQGPMVVPGRYEIRLTVGAETYRQQLTVKLDPRLSYSAGELERQLALAQGIAAGMNATYDGYNQVAQLRAELAGRLASLKQSENSSETLAAAQAADLQAAGLTDAAGPPAGLGPMNRDLTRLLIAVDQADGPPASQLIEKFTGMCQEAHDALERWNTLRTHDLPQLNALLSRHSLAPLTVPNQTPRSPDCGK